MELSYLDWLSAVGGLSSIIFAVSQFFGNLESAQLYATSAMFYPDSDENEADRKLKDESEGGDKALLSA